MPGDESLLHEGVYNAFPAACAWWLKILRPHAFSIYPAYYPVHECAGVFTKDVVVSKAYRCTLRSIAAFGLLSLAACTSKPSVPPADMAAFTAGMQSALINRINAANQGTLVGVVTLKITLNRSNQPTACTAMRASPQLATLLPVGAVPSDFLSLALLVERECWHTTYPPVPQGLFEHDRVEVVAPLVLMPRPMPMPSASH